MANTADNPRVIAYMRVSTKEQADSGLGLSAQRARIAAQAKAKGWGEVRYIEDAGYTARNTKRPGLREALELLDDHQADILIVASLDRLSRSVQDFTAILGRATKRGWGLVAMDLGVDTTTPTGQLVTNVMIAIAQWESSIIGERTSRALYEAQKKGTKLGRPSQTPPELLEEIRKRARPDDQGKPKGEGWTSIADDLNRRGITGSRGAAWTRHTVRDAALGTWNRGRRRTVEIEQEAS